jgi:hypothetical protein
MGICRTKKIKIPLHFIGESLYSTSKPEMIFPKAATINLLYYKKHYGKLSQKKLVNE